MKLSWLRFWRVDSPFQPMTSASCSILGLTLPRYYSDTEISCLLTLYRDRSVSMDSDTWVTHDAWYLFLNNWLISFISVVFSFIWWGSWHLHFSSDQKEYSRISWISGKNSKFTWKTPPFIAGFRGLRFGYRNRKVDKWTSRIHSGTYI